MQHESSHTKKRYIQRPGEVEECMDLPLPFRMQLMYHRIGHPGVLQNPVRSWCALCDPPPPPPPPIFPRKSRLSPLRNFEGVEIFHGY